MNHLISCQCGEVIVKSLDADTKIRAKIVVFRGQTAYAVCKACNTEVKIPLRIDTDLLKSMSTETRPPVRLYIRDTKRGSK